MGRLILSALGHRTFAISENKIRVDQWVDQNFMLDRTSVDAKLLILLVVGYLLVQRPCSKHALGAPMISKKLRPSPDKNAT